MTLVKSLYRTKLSCGRTIRLLAHPLSPALFSHQVVSLSQSSCVSPSSLLTGGVGGECGRGAKPYDREKALHSINYAKLSGDVQYNEDLQLIDASLDPFPT
jgi:hypothetical protein